jgi:hypothetical protein
VLRSKLLPACEGSLEHRLRLHQLPLILVEGARKTSGKFSALYIYELPWTLYEIEIINYSS